MIQLHNHLCIWATWILRLLTERAKHTRQNRAMQPNTNDTEEPSFKPDDIPPITRGADRRPTILPVGRQTWQPPADGITMEDLYRIRDQQRRTDRPFHDTPTPCD